MKQKLIFVYNADSSLFNQVGDLIHKTISPKTYQCRLCGLTYSGINMKDNWKDFIQNLDLLKEFLHKDKFIKQYPKFSKIPLPAIFIEKHGRLSQLISSRKINKQHSLKDLENLILQNLKNER